jgi:hypothetical protein
MKTSSRTQKPWKFDMEDQQSHPKGKDSENKTSNLTQESQRFQPKTSSET